MSTAPVAEAAPERSTVRPAVVVEGLSKMFVRADKREVYAVDGIDLSVSPGEFVVLLGPSGCGKTTLLRCIAGLEEPDSGRILVDGREVYSSEKHLSEGSFQRGISMIFQSYALWPHMTAFKNVAYPLESRRSTRPSKNELRERVLEALAMVGIEDLAEQYPHQLSGGQQQRVALARALVMRSPVVLFDEPLSNVDAKVREQLRYEIVELQKRIGFAAIYVTHDQAEAMALADRVAVIQSGRILQLDTPEVVYAKPNTPEVARFVGIANELIGRVEARDAQGISVATEVGTLRCLSGTRDFAVGDEVRLVWRPEDTDMEPPAGAVNAWRASVESQTYLGPQTEYRLHAGASGIRAWRRGQPDGNNDEVAVSVLPEHLWAMDLETELKTAAVSG